MRCHIAGLGQTETEPLAGLFLARVERAVYRAHIQKPFFTVFFVVLEPKQFQGRRFSGRLYGTPKALWKLNWFLRDFGYDRELMERDEVDEKALAGMRGVIRVSYTDVNGHSFLNLEGFAPSGQWEELSSPKEVPK